MKRTLLAIIAFFMIFAQTLTAQNYSAEGENDLKNVEVSIKFSERTMYHPGDAEGNPVKVHITLMNKSSKTQRFKLAEDRMFSVDFRAFNIKNTQLGQTDLLREKRTTNKTVYYREISLEPQEEYSFVENLKEYLNITEPSIYYVELNFYPELYRSGEKAISSNRLTLEVKPSPTAASSSMIPVKENTGALLERQEIGPDKVVEQTIIARQNELWDQFFLYMDLEELLKDNQSLARRYNNSSAAERNDMLNEFKAELMQSRICKDIVTKPKKFEIKSTNYDPNEGTVKVEEWFEYDKYKEKKLYTYYVRQRDGIWQIYKYNVMILEK